MDIPQFVELFPLKDICFEFLAIMNIAAMNICVRFCVYIISLEHMCSLVQLLSAFLVLMEFVKQFCKWSVPFTVS